MNRIKESIEQSIEVKNSILSDEKLLQSIESAVDVIVESLRNGGKIHFCGNGGSAADAQHLAAELSGRFYLDRVPLNAEALHCNTSYMTAVSNDYGYDFVFSRLLTASGRKGDVLGRNGYSPKRPGPLDSGKLRTSGIYQLFNRRTQRGSCLDDCEGDQSTSGGR